MKLFFHPYKYFPYERQLAIREVEAVLGMTSYKEITDGIEISQLSLTRNFERLVYFSHVQVEGEADRTVQAQLENAVNPRGRRQSTRYSSHGLHEYKGKFNPQVAKAILNIFGVQPGHKVLDPFCGSGTTLVECAQLGAKGIGLDINPLAVFLANAKLLALRTPAHKLEAAFNEIKKYLAKDIRFARHEEIDQRQEYLNKWFTPDVFIEIEKVRSAIERATAMLSPVFLSIASNLLREYSLQDPADLRIRRRKSPLPSLNFTIAFEKVCEVFITTMMQAQAVLKQDIPLSYAQIGSSTDEAVLSNRDELFDAAITSPPYAMALPYIDTQRLSLVWLELIEPKQILKLEAELIGSREMRAEARRGLPDALLNNSCGIPAAQHALCLQLQRQIGPADGFRRVAVPVLLYRYFSQMRKTFFNVRTRMKSGAPFALIVGHNHTTLGGVRQDIDTPRHLASIASENNWIVEEMIELQTYHRFGLHAGNAVAAETMIMLRAS